VMLSPQEEQRSNKRLVPPAERGDTSALSEAAVSRAIVGLKTLPSESMNLEMVDHVLGRLAVELNQVAAFERSPTRRLPVVIGGAPYFVQSVREIERGLRLCGALSDRRAVYRTSSNRLVVRECLEVGPDSQSHLTEEGWSLEAVEPLADGRIICSGTHKDYGREMRLISEFGAGVWSVRLLATDSGYLHGIAAAPDTRVFLASSRGLGCILDVTEPKPRISWLGSPEAGYRAIDATTEGRVVVAGRRGIEMWYLREREDPQRETVSLDEWVPSQGERTVRILAHGEVLSVDGRGVISIWQRSDDGSWNTVYDRTTQGPWRVISAQALPDGSCVAVTDTGSVQRIHRVLVNGRWVWTGSEIVDSSAIHGYPRLLSSGAGGEQPYGHVFPTGEVVFGLQSKASAKSFEVVCSRMGGR
jgi:hypothetical protein